jgi:hypothetical protein
MPLTKIQKEILALLAGNRSEDSHFAGGLVLNVGDESARYSHDFDIFHEAKEEVARASDADIATLREAGFAIEYATKTWDAPANFRKAKITRGDEFMEIDWAADSAVRYFPIEQDALLGWRLHLFDMATNKALALCARTETRDYVDIVELDAHFPLEAICWAACGKDPGFSPLFLLKMMRRFAKIDPVTLDEIKARELDPIDLKRKWIDMSDRAEAAMERVANQQPDLPIGIAFLDQNNTPRWFEHSPDLMQHPPTVRGCLPQLADGGA